MRNIKKNLQTKKNTQQEISFYFFIMKKSSLLLATAVLASAGLKAEAYDFNDKIYGKANAMIGYSLDFLDEGEDAEDQGHHWFHNLQFQGGYNVYFKASELIHPFAGLRAGFNAPLKAREDGEGGKTWTMNSLFYFDGVFGAKFNICKKFAVQPYAFLGYSLSRQTNENAGVKEASNTSRLSTGAGVDGIYELNDKLGLIGGVEYKYIGCGSMKTPDGETVDMLGAHQIGFHFGVQFL